MPININNTTQANRASGHKPTRTVQNSDANTEQSTKAVLGQDSINLTQSSMRLKSLEAQVARLPIVDTQKVEQVKNSLNDGTFELNSYRVAGKFISFEKSLL